MIYLIVIAFVIIIVAFYGSFANDANEYSASDIAAFAKQMVYHHSAATRACGSDCAGDIDPLPELSLVRQAGDVFANGTFRSLATGDYVVTYYVHRLDEDLRSDFQGRIVAAIPDFTERDTSFWAGPYDAATGQVDTGGPVLWRDPLTGTVSPTTQEVLQLDIGAIPNGAPVIATRK